MIKVLKNWQEIGDATLNLQRKNLPNHTDTRKNWDQFLLYNAIDSQDRNSYIIDLGCSPYCTLTFLHALGFKNLYGVDLDIPEADIKNANGRLYKGDLTKTPFPKDLFDFAISISVIEHGVDLNAFFQEASRILKLNGLLFLTTDYWQEEINIAESIKPLGLPWKIFNQNDIEGLINIAKNYGFTIETDIIPPASDRTVIWQGIEYTFISLLFKKTTSLPQITDTEDKRNTSNQAEDNPVTVNLAKNVNLSIDKYRQNPSDKSTLTALYQARKELADFWLNAEEASLEEAYIGDLGNAQRTLLESGIKYELITDAEQKYVADLSAGLAEGFKVQKFIPYLLAAMLYRHSYQLPIHFDITIVPKWFLNDYLLFMFESPRLFQELGEADIYYEYVRQWIDYLHDRILNHQESELWNRVSQFFFQKANFIALYFNQQNLKDIYKKRADILEFVLKTQGYEIDYDFPERNPDRKKIRLGILAAHFQPQTETFATLPIYKHLNRDLFEIILYTISAGNHRLERYCWGHADGVIVLPSDLANQVQSIRDNDLDILLIATNVTAWANPIALLALQRLARIQIANVCSCVTTGMRHVDYYISGKLAEPDRDAEQHYTEQLLALNGSAHCYDFATEEQLQATISVNREKLGISQEDIVYISGANFFKITPEVVETWTKIVAGVPNSKLVLYPFNPNWSSSYAVIAFKGRLLASFAQYGLREDRLIILDSVPNIADVKERLKLGDIYLDSYPFAGATSLLDPLQLGLPTVVMEGKTFRSLVGTALLKELDIYELIAENEASYIDLAIALGKNPALRQQKSDLIKQKMQRQPRFLNSRAYSALMQDLFQQLWKTKQTQTLYSKLKLNDINLIIFPDWSQPEESLFPDLANAIAAIATHPNKTQITLLVDTTNIEEEDANLALSSLAMDLLMASDLDVSEGLEISTLGQISAAQWEMLLPRLHTRIVLENENKQAIIDAKAEHILSLDLDNFSHKKAIQLETGYWEWQ